MSLFHHRLSLSFNYLFLFLTLCISLCSSFEVGDPVSMLKRSAYQGYVSGWSEVVYHDCPLFGVSRSIQWNPLSSAYTYDSSSPYKIAFSFNQHQHLTTFITINDGSTLYLHSITFSFINQHGGIVDFTYDTEYKEIAGPDKGVADYSIHVHYIWIEQAELAPIFGMETMMITWLALIWIMIIFITIRSYRGQQPHSSYHSNAVGSTKVRASGIDSDRQRISQMMHTKGV